jgi:hypothetical protein
MIPECRFRSIRHLDSALSIVANLPPGSERPAANAELEKPADENFRHGSPLLPRYSSVGNRTRAASSTSFSAITSWSAGRSSGQSRVPRSWRSGWSSFARAVWMRALRIPRSWLSRSRNGDPFSCGGIRATVAENVLCLVRRENLHGHR